MQKYLAMKTWRRLLHCSHQQHPLSTAIPIQRQHRRVASSGSIHTTTYYYYCSLVVLGTDRRRRGPQSLPNRARTCVHSCSAGTQGGKGTRRNTSDVRRRAGSNRSESCAESQTEEEDIESRMASSAGRRETRQEKSIESGSSKALGMLGQSFNGAGIASFFYILRREPSLAVPHVDTPDLRNVKWEELRRAGFKGCIFDKDNTLTEPYAMKVHPFASQALTECIRVFGKEKVVLYSNSAGLTQFDPEGKEAEKMENALGLVVLRHGEKKPGGGAGDVEAYFGCKADRLIMVGDRYLTDVAFGNRLGMMTIRPRPFTMKGEPMAVRMSRWIEEKFVASCVAKGVQAPRHELLSRQYK